MIPTKAKPKPKVMKNGAVSDAATLIRKPAAKKTTPKKAAPKKPLTSKNYLNGDITKIKGWMGGRGTI